ICEGPLARVAEQVLLAGAGNEQVGQAVVVEVADAAPQTGAGLAQSRLRGYVDESAIAVVEQEEVAHLSSFHHGTEQPHVWLAVAVVVEDDDSGAEAFAGSGAKLAQRARAKINARGPSCPWGKDHLELVEGSE